METITLASKKCPICDEDGFNSFMFGNHSRCVLPLTCHEAKDGLNRKEVDKTLSLIHRGIDHKLLYSLMTYWRVNYCAFGIPPTLNQLDKLRQTIGSSMILEIGAGLGLWSAVLKAYDFNVKATDPHPERLRGRLTGFMDDTGSCSLISTSIPQPVSQDFRYTEVEEISSSQAIAKYPDADVLLFVWPEYAFDLEKFTGKYILVQGENYDGCTHLSCEETLLREWKVVEVYDTPRFMGINDILVLYERVPKGSMIKNKIKDVPIVGRDGEIRKDLRPWVDRAIINRLSLPSNS